MTPNDPQKPPQLQPGEVRSRHYRAAPSACGVPGPRNARRRSPPEAGPWRPGPETQVQKSSRARHAALAAEPTPSPLPSLPCSRGRPHSLPGFIPKPHIWSLCLRLCFRGTWAKTLTSQLQFFLKTGMIRLIPQGCSDNERRFANHLTWGLPGAEEALDKCLPSSPPSAQSLPAQRAVRNGETGRQRLPPSTALFLAQLASTGFAVIYPPPWRPTQLSHGHSTLSLSESVTSSYPSSLPLQCSPPISCPQGG